MNTSMRSLTSASCSRVKLGGGIWLLCPEGSLLPSGRGEVSGSDDFLELLGRTGDCLGEGDGEENVPAFDVDPFNFFSCFCASSRSFSTWVSFALNSAVSFLRLASASFLSL